ncbi:MAG: flagellar basal body L-ring protein [Acidimicrobiales bacterium]|nr:flagellar basal body L-ring protein [Hyphomonadaceae bacterium]RZV44776.1 MAG: flagellar basal body L-ring protein [Acidimicrobiales bacterium]
MKQSIVIASTSVFLLAACASTDAVMEPKSLPDNWVYNTPQSSSESGAYQPTPAVDRTQSGSKSTSLWSSSPQSLFGDRRASDTGDILTVVIEIDDEAELQNSIAENRQMAENFGANAFLGLPELASRILPDGATLSPAVDLDKTSSRTGNGNISRQEKITLRLAARVVSVNRNGYMQLAGRQEIMVNNEIRYLQVTGLVRKQDISRLNTITYDKIAEARIYYGGQGTLTESTRPKAGNKILGKILPF